MEFILDVEHFPFTTGKRLGHGVNADVFDACSPNQETSEDDGGVQESVTHWVEQYFDLNDFVGTESVSSDSSDSDSESSDEDDNEETFEPMVVTTDMGPVETVVKLVNIDPERTASYCFKTEGVWSCIYTSATQMIKAMAQVQTAVECVNVLTIRTSSTLLELDTFHNDAVCGHILSSVIDSPHICRTFNVYRENSKTGAIQMEKMDGDMVHVLESTELDTEAIAGFYFQVLFVLQQCQDKLRFKHHDLHPYNVFLHKLTPTDLFHGEPLMSASHFEYTGRNGVKFYVPNSGYIAKIGDFDLASLKTPEGVEVRRIDINCYTSKTWGVFKPFDSDDDASYDAQTLLSRPPFRSESRRRGDESLRAFLCHLRSTLHGDKGRIGRATLRPMVLSGIKPIDVASIVFRTIGVRYNFTKIKRHKNVRVVNMGNLEM